MPNRIIREGIISSRHMADLVNRGGWEAEVFYRRLLNRVDDFGRFTADPSLLRTDLFPRQLDLVREINMERSLSHCEAASLVRLYEVDGEPYLEILRFRQQTRANTSKYPDPPPVDAQQMLRTCAADATHVRTKSDTHTESYTESDTNKHLSTDVSTVAATASPMASPDEGPVLVTFPCVAGKKTGQNVWQFRQKFYDELREAFPDIDVLSETKKSLLWINTNSKKTYDGMPRFLLRWMGKAQNYSGRRPPKITASDGAGTRKTFKPG